MIALARRRAEEEREVEAAVGRDAVKVQGSLAVRLEAAERGRALLQTALAGASQARKADQAAHAAEADALQREVQRLSAALDRADAELAALLGQPAVADAAALERRVAELTARVAELEAAPSAEAQTSAEIAGLRASLLSTRESLNDAERSIKQLRAEGASLRSQIAKQSAPAANRRAQALLDETRAELAEATKRAEAAEEQVRAMTSQGVEALRRLLRSGPKSITTAAVGSVDRFVASTRPVASAARLLAAGADREPEGPGRLEAMRALAALLRSL